MKNNLKTLLVIAVLSSIFFLSCGNASSSGTETGNDSTTQTFNLDTTKLHAGDSFYQCPMHPEFISDKPGSCPKCKMDLVEMKKH